MFGLSQKTNQKLQIFVVAILVMWQFTPLLPGVSVQKVSAAIECSEDTAGPNDEPGQKDLTKLCAELESTSGVIEVEWNWDELGTSGNNTLDGCALFDTDGDGNINYASCVTTEGNPASLQSLTIYTCGDDKVDRCTSPANPVPGTYSTNCSIAETTTDPFPAGDDYPNDITASCNIYLSEVGGEAADLIDVCSYPSAEPNSNPSDCVFFQAKTGKVEIVKDLVPAENGGLFNLQIDGVTEVADVGDGGSTGEVILETGTYTIGETAGTNTSLSSYDTSIECRNSNGTGSVIASAESTSTSLTVGDGEDIVCVITNVASGSITIIKDVQPLNFEQDFNYTTTGTGLSDFTLDDDGDNNNEFSNSITFDGLNAGTYSVTEVTGAEDGWTLANIMCNGSDVTENEETATATINLSSGEDVTCTFTNHENGQIMVTKQTLPDGSEEDFSITASGNGTIFGNATRTIIDDQTVIYDVTPGTYTVTEATEPGWVETENENNCSNLVVEPGQAESCTITNTQLGQITINKDADPNGPQDFAFSFTGTDGFTLDDDDDPELSNQEVIGDLLPGEYTVTEAAIEGWDLTSLTCSEDEGFDDSKTDLASRTATITLSAGEVMSCTFVNTERGSISGTKYEVDADAIDGSSGTASDISWTIELYQDDSFVTDTTTDGNGNYAFTNLKPGNYVVKEVLKSGWTQVFPTSPNYLSVTVEAGAESTGNDFGNFKNGEIKAYKYEDINANGQYDAEDERKLEGWELTLSYDMNEDGEFSENEVISVQETLSDGSYTFENLAPGDYQVCETPQNGWERTDPTTSDCRESTINLSGELNVNYMYFGNRPIGTITVIKNLDMNDDDQADVENKTDWRWYLNGNDSTTYTTGSENTIEVTANQDYTVSEMLKTDYHLSNVVCSGEEFAEPNTTVTVSVEPGEDVVCTFLNSRDSGNITVTKLLNPTEDNGLFDFDLTGSNGALSLATDLSHNESDTLKVPTGNYSIEELAGTDTSLGNYDSEYVCYVGPNLIDSGSDTTTGTLILEKGASIDCFFTNTRHGSISGTKNEVNNDESLVETLSGWLITLWQGDTQVNQTTTDEAGNYSFDGLSPGDYTLTEELQEGWTQIYSPSPVTLEAGESDNENDFGNFRNGSIHVTKFHDINGNSEFDSTTENLLSGWTITIEGNDVNRPDKTTEDGIASYTNLAPGTYTVCEVEQVNWQRTFPADSNCQDVEINVSGETEEIMFGNQARATIQVTKQTLPENSEQVFGVKIDGSGDIISDPSTSISDNQTVEFTVGFGEYDVTEDVPEGWSVAYEGCEDIIINEPGQAESCTITNTKLAQVTITKVADPSGPQAFSFTFTGPNETNEGFTLDDNDDSEFSNQEVNDGLLPGEYTVSEAAVEGWDLTSLTCDEQEGFDDSQTNLLEGTATINLSAGEVMSCTFENTERGSIVVEKEIRTVNEDTTQTFGFSVDSENLTIPRTDIITGGESFTVESLKPGEYTITETAELTNWELVNISCSTEDQGSLELQSVEVTLNPGQQITCTFTNQELANVTVLKYNDLINRGVYDETENENGIKDEPLEGWTMNLDSETPEYENEINDVEASFFVPDFSKEDYSQVTGTDGLALFENIQPGVYSLSEVLQDGWKLSDITCDIEREFRADALEIEKGNNSEMVYVAPGSDINCYVGNYQDLVLTIAKDNDQPEGVAEFVGDTVVYTLEVTVPEDSGVSYNTVVTDLPPEGFEYIPGSWTAQSSERGNLKSAGTTTEPTYASPGDWQLGTMIPGEIVTLTYAALITNSTSPGDYPDIAFVQGQDADESTVFGNLHITEDDPFVGTVASVIEVEDEADVVFAAEERVLGIQNLPATGPENNWMQIFLIPALIGMAYYLLDRRFSYAFQRRREQ